jgi:hypothetical protein
MHSPTPAGTGSTTREAPLGMVSLAAFGLVLFWVGACSLWIWSLIPSEAALPVFGFLYFGVLGLSSLGVLCALLGLFLTRRRRWIAVVGLVLNGAPWAYVASYFAGGQLRLF